jgi:RNA polymerase sigma-70 factor (ECF subfamily)
MGVSGRDLAVEDLYLRHDAALRRFLARMLHCDDAAADVAQEAWARLVRLGPKRAVDDPKAYLYQIAANAARDRMARERTRKAVADGGPAPEDVAGPEPDAETVALARERLHLLAAAMDDLPPRCREVFLMRRFDGLTNGEIAERLGISRNMVEKHVIRAMMHCRRCLDAVGK